MFKLFEHSKYMIIYKIVNSWNFDSFPNWSILKICYCSKLNNFRNLMFVVIAKFWKFLEFLKLQIFWIFKITNFWKFPDWFFFLIFQITNFWKFPDWFFFNFPNCKFFEFSEFEVFGIVQIAELSEILFNLENQSSSQKIGNFVVVRPFDIPHYLQFWKFSYLSFDMNKFWRFKFSTFISYSSGNFLDWQIHEIFKFLKLFNLKN